MRLIVKLIFFVFITDFISEDGEHIRGTGTRQRILILPH